MEYRGRDESDMSSESFCFGKLCNGETIVNFESLTGSAYSDNRRDVRDPERNEDMPCIKA